MQDAERDAPILHEWRCEQRLMRRTSRAEADRRIGRPSVVRVDADSVAWRRISIEREPCVCPCRVVWTTRKAAATQPTFRLLGGFSLMP
jgi:hypothetical protein